ncbi:MAG: antitoxin VbhA family protein [Lachnospiraceae bacterium]|nr:antitoxin VbhA family protein [Lachnospiraceae bacterium]
MMEAMDLVQARTTKSVKVSRDIYTPTEAIREIDTTLKMEGMSLTPADLDMLKEIGLGNLTTDEARQKILNKV